MHYGAPVSTALTRLVDARDTPLQTRLARRLEILSIQLLEPLESQPGFHVFVQAEFDRTFSDLEEPVDLCTTFIKSVAKVPPSAEPVPTHAPEAVPQGLLDNILVLWPTLMDAVVTRLVAKAPADYASAETSLHRAAADQEGLVPVSGLDIAAFDRFLDTLAEGFLGAFKQFHERYWQAPLSATDSRSRKQWLVQKRVEMLKVEVQLLKADGVLALSDELLFDLVTRHPDAVSRQRLDGYRPCVYGVVIKDGPGGDIPLYGAFVITTRDQDDDKVLPVDAVKPPQVRPVESQANVGAVLLYLPGSGVEGFDSLASLDRELHRRLHNSAESSDLLALIAYKDQAHGLAMAEQPARQDRIRYQERLESVFLYSLDALFEKAQHDVADMLARYQDPDSGAEIGDLPQSLEQLVSVRDTFGASSTLMARLQKRTQVQIKDFLKGALPADVQAWEAATRAYCDALVSLSEVDGLPDLAQFSDPAKLLEYSNTQVRIVLEAEHGLTVNPDHVMVHTKDYAPRQPGSFIPGAKPQPAPPGTQVFTLHKRSLTALALENVSGLEAKFAEYSQLTGQDGEPYSALTTAQVKALVRKVNIGDSYERFLKDRLVTSSTALADQLHYVQLMHLQLRADALEAKMAGDFLPDRADRGYQWVMSVLDCPEDTDQRRQVEGHRILVQGLKLRGERVRGVLVFSSASASVSNKVVYTAQAPGGRRFHEYPDTSALYRDFINHSAWRDYLVERVALSARPLLRTTLRGRVSAALIMLERIAGNVLEAAYQLEASAVINQAGMQTTSTQETNWETASTLLTLGLDVVSVVLPIKIMLPIGLARCALSVISAVEAAQAGDRAGAAHYVVRSIGELLGAVLDGAIGTASIRRPTPAGLGLSAKKALAKKPGGVTPLDGWEGQGVFTRNDPVSGAAQHFLEDKGHWYSIFRDNDNTVWRVRDARKPHAYHHEAIRRNSQGAWEVRSPARGLRGGAPDPTPAEAALMALYPAMSQAEARRAFDLFAFPQGARPNLEMVLVHQLRTTGRVSDDFVRLYLNITSQQFVESLSGLHGHTSSVAVPLEPTPGPSRASVIVPRERPAPEPTPGPSRGSVIVLRERPAATPESPSHQRVVGWAQALAPDDLQLMLSRPRSARRAGAESGPAATEYIEIDGSYYRTLPDSNASRTDVLVTPSEGVPRTFAQWERLLRLQPLNQPRVAVWVSDIRRWQVVLNLPFSGPMTPYLMRVFRQFTQRSITSLATALFDHANPHGLTVGGHRQMANILQDWSTWERAGVPMLGDPLQLMTRLPRSRNSSWFLRELLGQFSILWFRIDRIQRTLVDSVLRSPSAHSMRAMMRTLLNRSRYETFEMPASNELLFRRPGQDTLYWLTLHLLQSEHMPSIATAPPSQWALRGNLPGNLRPMLTRAINSGNLVQLVGGLQMLEGLVVKPFIFRP